MLRAYPQRNSRGMPGPDAPNPLCLGLAAGLAANRVGGGMESLSRRGARPGILIFALACAMPGSSQLPASRFSNPVYVQSAGLPGAPAAKATLAMDAGFQGIMWEDASAGLPELLGALRARKGGLAGPWRNPQSDIAGDLALLDTAGPFFFIYVPNGPYKNDAEAAAAVAAVGDRLAPSGRKVAIYPHAPDYVSNTLDAVKIAKLANRPNVGVSFNLCHELMYCNVHGKNFAARFDSLTRTSMQYIFTASISGGDSVGKDWGVLIRPLGEGTFDTWPVVKTLVEKNFKGPFLLQAFGISQDPKTHLAKSMKVLEEYRRRLPAVYGCMDPAYVEYDAKANVALAGACKTKRSTSVRARPRALTPGESRGGAFDLRGRNSAPTGRGRRG